MWRGRSRSGTGILRPCIRGGRASPAEPGTPPGPEAGSHKRTATLRVTGAVPSEVRNRLGPMVVPRLRVGDGLRVGVDFDVSLLARQAEALESELRQVLAEPERSFRSGSRQAAARAVSGPDASDGGADFLIEVKANRRTLWFDGRRAGPRGRGRPARLMPPRAGGLLARAGRHRGCRRRDDAGSRRRSGPPSTPGPRPEHLRVHGLLRGLDHLLHHRDPHRAGSRAQRHRVRHPGGHPDPDRLAQPHLSRDLDRPVRRARRVHAADGGHRGRHLDALDGRHVPDVPARRPRGGACRRLVRGRHRVRVALVRPRAPGDRARGVRDRQRGRGRHQLRGAVPAPRRRMGTGRPGLRGGAPRHRGGVLLRDEGGPGHRPAPGDGREAAVGVPPARAAAPPPGLEVLALLLLRLRGVRGARALAAAVLRRRLRPGHQDRGDAGRGLRAARKRLPGPRRLPLRSLRRPRGDVLDVPRERRRLLLPELSVHGLRGPGGRGADRVQPHHLAPGLRCADGGARLRDVAREGGGLQAHSRLLPGARGLGRRARRHDRRARRVHPSDLLRGDERPHRGVDEAASCCSSPWSESPSCGCTSRSAGWSAGRRPSVSTSFPSFPSCSPCTRRSTGGRSVPRGRPAPGTGTT